jgi:peptidoglycan/LPS O-acetylase OafA/YrhL
MVAQSYFGSSYRDAVNAMLSPVLVALLLVQCMAFRETPPWAWLNWRWVRYLGRISYSVYLYQQVAVPLAMKVLRYQALPWRVAGAVVAVVVMATASYYVVELPFLKLKERFRSAPPTGDSLVMPAT